MNKPEPKYAHGPTLDYHECETYIEEKYNIKVRDYLGKFANNKVNNVEYLDFWHWLIDRHEYIQNGSYFHLAIDEHLNDPDVEEWVKTILKMFKDEFGHHAKDGYIKFYVWW